MNLNRYQAIFAVPGARLLVLGATLSRQSAMLLLAQVLLVRQATNSYAIAGAATAAFTVAQGFGAPLWARKIDRYGPRSLITALALLDGGALLALVVCATAGSGAGALIALAALVGVFGPPTVPAMRMMWSRLLRDPGQRHAAYALETALTELAFVSGPLATAGLVTLASPAIAVLTGSAFLVGGSLLFALVAANEPTPDIPRRVGRLGPLHSAGIRPLIVIWIPLGASFTALDIVVPAFCQRDGAPGLAGVLLAATAAGAVLGAIAYGALRPPRSASRTFHRACLAFGLALIPVAISSGVAMLAVLLFLAGAAFSPIAAVSSQWIDHCATPNQTTEAFTWLLTAYMAGGALGAQAAGLAVSELGVSLAMATPAIFGMTAAICALIGTGPWRVRVQPPTPLLGNSRVIP